MTDDAKPDSAASWVASGLRGFGESVLSVVPAGFPAYARVLHPAYLGSRRVRWSDIAAANGRRANRVMQFCALTGGHHRPVRGQPGVFDQPPQIGSLPPEIAATLIKVLGRHTRTPGRCYFAIWEGWAGYKTPARHPDLTTANRRYYLRLDPIEALLNEQHPPSLWWPEDRSWCVATEIDLDSTYLGTSWSCLRELIAQTDIECLVAEPDDGIGYDADLENPITPDHPQR